MFVPSLTYDPSSVNVPSSIHNFSASAHVLVPCSLDDDNVKENPPPPTQPILVESIEHEHEPTPYLPRWVYTT
jgi:hypothetical protein